MHKYFEVANKIHELCDVLKLSVDDARLFVYLYVKIKENNNVDYFDDDHDTERLVLELMLGKNSLKEVIENKYGEPEIKESIDKLISSSDTYASNIAKNIVQSDKLLLDKHGLEFRFGSELTNRLRLYTDKNYRDKKINIFKNEILPKL